MNGKRTQPDAAATGTSTPTAKATSTESPEKKTRVHGAPQQAQEEEQPAGQVWVFGSGDCGQLALGEEVLSCTRPRRQPFFDALDAVAVAAGGLHTLVLTRAGAVYAWGCNDERALGHSAEEFSVARVEGLVDGAGAPERIVQVACGDSISAALTADGRVFTWGTFRDSKGLLGVADESWVSGSGSGSEGTGNSIGNSTGKGTGSSTGKGTGKGTGNSTGKGTGKSQGHGQAHGQAHAQGHGHGQSTLTTSNITNNTNTNASSTSLHSTLTRTSSQSARSRDYHERPTPLQAMQGLTVRRLAAGANHLLALTQDGEVYAWGSGEQGQLGRRVLERHKLRALLPTRITPRAHRAHGGIASVFCGAYHSFLLARDGTVFAVGLNNFGQLGLGDCRDRLAPVPVPPEAWQGHRIVALAAGEHHSLALAATGRVFAFGRADSGQLGLGALDAPLHHTGTSHAKKALPTPVLVPLLSGCIRIAAGSNHNIATTAANDIYTWGFGEMGQLGHGVEEDELQPRLLAWKGGPAPAVLDASAGGQHSVLLMRK